MKKFLIGAFMFGMVVLTQSCATSYKSCAAYASEPSQTAPTYQEVQ